MQTYLKSRTGFDSAGSLVSAGNTGEETVEAYVGNGTDSDTVTKTCVEKYETDSKNVTSADTTYFLAEGLQHQYLFCVLEYPTNTHFIDLGDKS